MCFWLTREVVSLQSPLSNDLHKSSETSCVLAASHWLQGAVPQLIQPGVLPMARQSLPGLQGDNPSFLSERAFLPRARESSESAKAGRRTAAPEACETSGRARRLLELACASRGGSSKQFAHGGALTTKHGGDDSSKQASSAALRARRLLWRPARPRLSTLGGVRLARRLSAALRGARRRPRALELERMTE